MNKSSLLTAERLRELLSYDHETGAFTRLVSRSNTKSGDIAGSRHNQGYTCIFVDSRRYYAHCLVWLYVHGVWPPHQIDHINGQPDDNRLHNLRAVTRTGNNQNRRKAQSSNASGFLGVYLHRTSGKWRAQIQANGKKIHVGYFTTAQTAHAAYVAAKRRLHTTCTI